MFKVFFLLSAIVVAALAHEFKDPSYYDKYAHAPLDKHGQVIDTPEVSYAKHKHFEAVDDAIHLNLKLGGHYRTPDFHPEPLKLVHGMFLPDTPAVEQAKLEHFAAIKHIKERDSHKH